MPTHLDTLQDKERWGAWNQGAFLNVTTPEKQEVHLSRWDVHTLLVSATEAAFASAPSGSAARTEKVFLCSGGAASQPTELVIQQLTDANGWIAELRTLPGTSERFYRLGPWIVRVAPPYYYAYVHAPTTADEAARYRRSTSHGESYRAMFDGSRGYDRTDLAKRFLKGTQTTHAIPPTMAQLAVALLVSEAAHNWRTWGINLMLLDLLDGNATSGNQLIHGDQHPMARGSSFDQAAAKTGMKGGRATTETWSLEASGHHALALDPRRPHHHARPHPPSRRLTPRATLARPRERRGLQHGDEAPAARKAAPAQTMADNLPSNRESNNVQD